MLWTLPPAAPDVGPDLYRRHRLDDDDSNQWDHALELYFVAKKNSFESYLRVFLIVTGSSR